MSGSIQSILNLKDNMSPTILRAGRNTQQLSRQLKLATNTVGKFASEANTKFKNVVKYSATAAAGITATFAGAAIKTGFEEAMNLEGYRLQLETATKDAKKAASIMQYASDLANKTPYEAGELVEGASKLESMGMSAKKWLPIIGDMAAATNKSFDQAVEAIIDGQAGELERLKEFGLTKAKITEKANKMFKKQEVVNKKGQIVDQEKFNQAMVTLMNERFDGGMEKQAGTLKGIWSTVTGTAKSAMASFVGITSDGSIKQGSIYDKLKTTISSVASTLDKWQKDGTIDKITNKITTGLNKALDGLGKAVKFVKDNINWLLPVASGLLATFVSFNIISKAVSLFKTLSTVVRGVAAAQGVLNLVMSMNPMGLVAIAIGVLVTAGILLYKNWDTVKAKAGELWTWLKEKWEGIKSSTSDAFNSIKEKISGAFTGALATVKEKVNNMIGIVNGLINKINGISFKTPDWLPGEQKIWSPNIPTIPQFAKGTSYAPAGMALVGERGPELVNFRGGEKVTTASKTKQIMQKSSGVNLTINIGTAIGIEDLIGQVGEALTTIVSTKLPNMAR
ncbi:hypothetical protein G5B47_02535 [Paenibacillus sp. 7124]|uniref:Phage tail tape measure protein n=1 Tax=Paenibacillus apii TaxID=1850370 RepID=A0A6M1PGB1_9BACL|nr:hypothetical protein [Paenibacillus apii]NGM81285.1 hypothetical protein [Paenibacillus apii]